MHIVRCELAVTLKRNEIRMAWLLAIYPITIYLLQSQITKIIERQRFLTTDLSRCDLFRQNLSLRSSEDYIAINLL